MNDQAFAEAAARIMAANKAARDRFAAASSRVTKAIMGQDDGIAILRDFCGSSEASGAEQVEDRDNDENSGPAGTAGGAASESTESGSRSRKSAEAIVGGGI